MDIPTPEDKQVLKDKLTAIFKAIEEVSPLVSQFTGWAEDQWGSAEQVEDIDDEKLALDIINFGQNLKDYGQSI